MLCFPVFPCYLQFAAKRLWPGNSSLLEVLLTDPATQRDTQLSLHKYIIWKNIINVHCKVGMDFSLLIENTIFESIKLRLYTLKGKISNGPLCCFCPCYAFFVFSRNKKIYTYTRFRIQGVPWAWHKTD